MAWVVVHAQQLLQLWFLPRIQVLVEAQAPFSRAADSDDCEDVWRPVEVHVTSIPGCHFVPSILLLWD